MLIRPPQLAHAIRAGLKTRHTTPRAAFPLNPRGRVIPVLTERNNGVRDRICDMETLAATPGTLSDLTMDEARQEGHVGPAAFARWWIDTHDRAWVRKQHQDMADHFNDDPEDALEFLNELALNRFTGRWAGHPTWVLEVHAIHDLPRLLAARGGDEHGYTTSPWLALPDEPEAIPLDRLDPSWHDRSMRRHQRVRRERARQARLLREELSIHQRVMVAELAAYDRHLDLRSEFRLVRHMIRTGRPDHVVLGQLVQIERRVHPDEQQAA